MEQNLFLVRLAGLKLVDFSLNPADSGSLSLVFNLQPKRCKCVDSEFNLGFLQSKGNKILHKGLAKYPINYLQIIGIKIISNLNIYSLFVDQLKRSRYEKFG